MTFRLPQCLENSNSDRALSYLETYYGQPYTGSYFDTWAPSQNDPNTCTADDLLAVSLLSVVVPPLAAPELLNVRAAEFNALLREIGPNRDFAGQAEPVTEDQPASRLYRAGRALPGVGRTIGTKLLARKRPRLVPIYDSVVARVSTIGDYHWEPLRQALGTDSLHDRLLDLRDRAGLGPHVSALRVLDVVTWMEGKAAGVRPTDPDELLGESLTDPDSNCPPAQAWPASRRRRRATAFACSLSRRESPARAPRATSPPGPNAPTAAGRSPPARTRDRSVPLGRRSARLWHPSWTAPPR